MRVPIDASGRLVIPKPLRDELGVTGATELEFVAVDGRLELVVPDLEVHVEVDDGFPRFVASGPVAPLTTEDVRAAIERTRR